MLQYQGIGFGRLPLHPSPRGAGSDASLPERWREPPHQQTHCHRDQARCRRTGLTPAAHDPLITVDLLHVPVLLRRLLTTCSAPDSCQLSVLPLLLQHVRRGDCDLSREQPRVRSHAYHLHHPSDTSPLGIPGSQPGHSEAPKEWHSKLRLKTASAAKDTMSAGRQDGTTFSTGRQSN